MAASVWMVGALVGGSPEILQLPAMILSGAVTYFGATLLLWWATGRPAGPEREALDMLAFVRRRAFGH